MSARSDLKSVILLSVLLSCPQAGGAPDRLIGLLTLPDVFGHGPCETFTPKEIPLLAAPEFGAVIGAIRVDSPWTIHPEGGCEGLDVKVHRVDRGRAEELPTEEFAYEAPAAIVLDRREDWFRVRLQDGSAWVRAGARSEYVALRELLDRYRDGVHLTGHWEGTLRRAVDSSESVRVPTDGQRQVADDVRAARVLAFRQTADTLWVEVEVLSHSLCLGPREPTVVARGWLPAHAPAGGTTIWFSARGC
jgi:hypothetical protein